ncbi:MAG: hypothetical protein M3317_03155 [Actinomycetota bacterium]|nr:hypothetical protein [Actinomycetota bacterium]
MVKVGYFLASEEFGPGELIEQATSLVTEEMVAEAVVCGPERHVKNISQAALAGYDEVYVQQIGPEQESFFRFYEKEILPTRSLA